MSVAVATELFDRHRPMLDRAVQALVERTYWSPFSESPSPRVYGETAADDGKRAFDGLLGHAFELGFAHPSTGAAVQTEHSPFGVELGVGYPAVSADLVLAAAQTAQAGGRQDAAIVGGVAQSWTHAGPKAWVGVAMEVLHRLNARSFEVAHAVMQTTGQGWMMAFQAGGPHAQDRGLEAVACAWQQMSLVPEQALWEKPQGKNPPLRMQKRFKVMPRGVALTIGCCTFPTWNGYPGLFASLATGNAVVVKPHPGAVLPLAITVRLCREVLAENGFDPNVVTLAAHAVGDPIVQQLALDPRVKLIDFTGSSANGDWLEAHARQAQVYTEKAGVNQILIDSTDDLKGMARNIAFSLALYSGQMCTAPQNIYIPSTGVRTRDGVVPFDEVAAAIAGALGKLTAEAEKAVDLIGAIQNDAVVQRIAQARALADQSGAQGAGPRVLLDSRALQHPQFPQARVHTPLMLQLSAADRAHFMAEWFGPISFIIRTDDTQQAMTLAAEAVREHGALTLSAYCLDDDAGAAQMQALETMAQETGVALSLNLTGGVFVNQSAAFSDFHATGANPAANAALADAAFVANRYRVIQNRRHC